MDRQTVRLLFVVAIIVWTGVYLFVLSEGGLFERIRLKKEIRAFLNENNDIKNENDRLKKAVSSNSEKRPSREDLINSGFLRKGDKIIILKDGPVASDGIRRNQLTGHDGYIAIYRILWGAAGAVVFILLYFSWRRSAPGDQ